METTQKFLLNTCILRALARNISARKDIPFYLNGVHIAPHPEGAIYTATDGHMAMRWLDRDAPIVPFGNAGVVLDAEMLRKLPALTRTERRNRANEYTECHAEGKDLFRMNGVLFTPLAGKYPDVDTIFSRIQSNRSGQIAHVRAEYLIKTEKCVYERRGSKVYGLAWSHHGEKEAIFTGDDEFCAMVMPMRAGELPEIQSWMTTSGREPASPYPCLETLNIEATFEAATSFDTEEAKHRVKHAMSVAAIAQKSCSPKAKRRALLLLMRVGAAFDENTRYNRGKKRNWACLAVKKASQTHTCPDWATPKPKRIASPLTNLSIDDVMIEHTPEGVIAKAPDARALRTEPGTKKPYFFRSAAAAIAWAHDEIRKLCAAETSELTL